MDVSLKGPLWCYEALPCIPKSHPVLGPTIKHICSHLFTQTSLYLRFFFIPNLREPTVSSRSSWSDFLKTTPSWMLSSVPLSGWPLIFHCIFNGRHRPLSTNLLACPYTTSFSTFSTKPQKYSSKIVKCWLKPWGFSRHLTTFEEYCWDEGTLSSV